MRRKIPTLAAIVISAIVAGPSFAGQASADLPVLNVDQLCRDHWTSDARGVTYCIHLEQDGYDYAKIVWGTTTPDVKNYCLRVGWGNGEERHTAGKIWYDHSHGGVGFYQRLSECLLTMDVRDHYARPSKFEP